MILQPLRGTHQLTRHDTARILVDAPGFERGGHAHRNNIFLVGVGRNGLDARGRTQCAGLTNQRRRGNLDHHEPRFEAGVCREKRGQSRGQVGIHQPLDASLRHPGERGQGDREVIEGHGHRLTVKVAARHEVSVKHQGIVCGRVELYIRNRCRIFDRVAYRAHDLWDAAQTVRVLNAWVICPV